MNNIIIDSKISHNHALTCFLNSFLREWKSWDFDNDSKMLSISFSESKILIKLEYYSLVGRHTYSNEIYYVKDLENIKISFNQLVEVLLIEVANYFKSNNEDLEVFKNRIFQSTGHIDDSLSIRAEHFEKVYNLKNNRFIDIEQSLYVGHTFHPHPKNRDGFSYEESIKFSPEFGNKFNLNWLFVSKSNLHYFCSNSFNNHSWMDDQFLKEVDLEIPEGYSALCVHPYQLQHLLKLDDIKELIKCDHIRLVESKGNVSWTATSSLRSIYSEDSDYMLKFSLSVRLTNSIRHLLEHEVVRGIQVVDVFNSKIGKEFLERNDKFSIVKEPAFYAIKNINNKIINESIVSLRENPFKINEDNHVYVLATLTQDHPHENISLIGKILKDKSNRENIPLNDLGKMWFDSYLKVSFNPLLLAQAECGVLLGAHQQNMLLKLENGIPVKGYFRDCQGTGYTDVGFHHFKDEVKLITIENGNVLNEEVANGLFAYYLYVNSTLNIIASLARDCNLSEEELLKELKNNLINLKELKTIKDHSCIDYLLDSDGINQKGNFLCSIINMNENTTDNPFAIYNKMPNPLKNLI